MNNNINETKKSTKTETNKQVGIMIPKYRFDNLNLCLKITKRMLNEKVLESESYKAIIIKLKKALLVSKVETALAQHKAINLTATKVLIDFSNLKLERDGTVPGLEVEVLRIKKNQSYLFEKCEREGIF